MPKPMLFAEDSTSRRILYWCLQLFGWGTYFAYSEVLIVLYAHDRELDFIWPIVPLALLLTSHLLRYIIKRNRWIDLPLRKATLRLAGTICGLAVGVQTLLAFVMVGLGADTLREHLASVWAYTLYSIALFAMWTVLYLGFQYFFRYRDSELARLRLEGSLRETELKALKAQVNPHFLFNCLNNVRSLIAEDSERAREMVLRLSELLRYSLDAGTSERVPLSAELHVLRGYLELEKLQFEERLRWRIDISPEALNATIPPMLLQQLVENAIKHGIALDPNGGEICVVGQIRSKQLELRVENTGQLVPNRKPSDGLGLANARERLRLLGGAEAALSLENKDERHVAAIAAIPFEMA